MLGEPGQIAISVPHLNIFKTLPSSFFSLPFYWMYHLSSLSPCLQLPPLMSFASQAERYLEKQI